MGEMAGKQPTIIWDVDDVLNPLMLSWFNERWLVSRPACSLTYGGIVENPPHTLLGVSLGEYLESLDQFRLSDGFAMMEPVREVLDWFRSQGHAYRHMALTATPLRTAPGSANWVLRHFGQWIRSYNFVPSRREGETIPEYDRTKEEFLAWLGRGNVLVDDSPANIEGAGRAGLKTVLIPQPWNSSRRTLAEALQFLTQSLV